MTLFGLVRHGETEWNFRNLFQGASDIPLNDTGIRQAHQALEAAPAIAWDFVMSSTLRRAEHTARIIAKDHHLEFRGVHPGFREVNFGWAEGKPAEDVYAAYPDRMFPGRESIETVVARGTQAIRELAHCHPNKKILVVAHGTFIRYLLSGVVQCGFTSLPNASMSLLQVEPGRWRIPMIAGYSLKTPFVWEHEHQALPFVDPAWDMPHGINPGDLPLAEAPYASLTSRSNA